MTKKKQNKEKRTPEAFIDELLPRVAKHLERQRERQRRDQELLRRRHESVRVYQMLLNDKAPGVTASVLPEQADGALQSVQLRITVDGTTEQLELFSRTYRSSLDDEGKLKGDATREIERFLERALLRAE